MNHPGLYIGLLFWATLIGTVWLIGDLKNNGGAQGGYVCPPCGCPMHDTIMGTPGSCAACGMPLITVARPQSTWWQSMFRNTHVTFYHHKFFYPINFLALFVGFFALYRFRRERPTVLFLIFFLSLVLYSFKNQLHGTSYSMYASRKWAFFPISFLLAAGPALFLYCLKIQHPGNRLSRKEWLHFLPAACVLLSHAVLFLGLKSWRDQALYNNYDHYPGLAEQLTFIASGLYYSVSMGNIEQGNSQLSSTQQVWQWSLRAFLLLAVASFSLMLLGNYRYFDLMSTWLDYHPVWLTIALFTLWSTYYIVFRKEVIFQKSPVKENRLTDDKIAAWKSVLETTMQAQKPYLNPDLSLQMLAQTIGMKEKDLSEVLNTGFCKSFHDYVNYYQVEEVKKLLLDPEQQFLTNFALAQAAGFSSKSAFFGLFKKHVGMPPGAFKRTAGRLD